MANEARVYAEGPENCIVRSFSLPASTACPKGSLLVDGNGSRYAALHTAAVKKAVLGFAVASKSSADANYASVSTIGCQRTGVVEAVADGFIEAGDVVIAGQSTANRVQAVKDGYLSVYNFQFQVLGRALTEAADGAAVKIALTLG